MKIGVKIKDIRENQSRSRKWLADQAGISEYALYKIEAEGAFPRSETVNRIVSALGITMSLLLLYCVDESDAPSKKRDAANMLLPVIRDLFSK